MRGNSHVQFLGGDGVVMHCLYPTFWKTRNHQASRHVERLLIVHPMTCPRDRLIGRQQFWRQPSTLKAQANCRMALIAMLSGLKTRRKTGDRSFGNLFSKAR